MKGQDVEKGGDDDGDDNSPFGIIDLPGGSLSLIVWYKGGGGGGRGRERQEQQEEQQQQQTHRRKSSSFPAPMIGPEGEGTHFPTLRIEILK